MENLCAAIPLAESLDTVSVQEFQKMLSSWFEEKGVLSDLRLQLRFKMVNVLKDTMIGRNIGKRNLHRLSFSKQAVNTIVAEFLMRNECYYTLSMFNTEATLTYVLPTYPLIIDSAKKENNMLDFDKENILHILELIGIPKTSEYCEELFALYFNYNEKNSLLFCLISLLCKLVNTFDRKSSNDNFGTECVDTSPEEGFMKKVWNILIQSNLSMKNCKNIFQNIKSVYQLEQKYIEGKHATVINDLTNKITAQETYIKSMNKTNRILENQVLKINRDYRRVKSHMKNLIIQENMTKELQMQQTEKQTCFLKTLNNDLNKNYSVVNSPSAVKNGEMCQLKHCSDICKNNIIVTENLLKENKKLKEENKEQEEQIKKLSWKYKELTSKFIECQNKINLLNMRINGESKGFIENILSEENLTLPEVHLKTNADVSDVSSDSVTEEILHQARLRLRKLEEETKKIEETFKCYHLSLQNIDA